MAFTSWSALRTAIKDALASYVDGAPCVGAYSIGGRNLQYRSVDDLKRLLEITYELESLEDTGEPSSRISYGRHRRFM